MTDKRTLRIFCPTHEAAFEAPESPKILCEITAHALSVGFPTSEFWEFCCNCETFTPSRLDKGEKARAVCYGCGNDISKRFVCASCKTAGFECGAQTKGKRYSIGAGGVEPACPGCQTTGGNGALTAHHCEEIGASVLTARADCPFCLQKIAGVEGAGGARAEGGPQVCPNCGAERIPGANFCGKCRQRLRDDVAVTSLGSDVNRTRLLGSLCPNCSSPLAPDSGFCGTCGQAVKKAPPQPEQPAPVKAPEVRPPAITPTPTPQVNGARNVLVAIGIGLFLVIVLAALFSGPKRTVNSVNNANTTNTANANANANSSMPSSFQRDYQGTINGRDFWMTLNKSGRTLTGSARTLQNTDTLSGTIEADGSFRADGLESGLRRTGMYEGRVYADGTASGNWVSPARSIMVPFSVSQR